MRSCPMIKRFNKEIRLARKKEHDLQIGRREKIISQKERKAYIEGKTEMLNKIENILLYLPNPNKEKKYHDAYEIFRDAFLWRIREERKIQKRKQFRLEVKP